MKFKVIVFFISFYCILFISAFTKPLAAYSLVDEMHNVVDVIGHTYHINYGPAPWKNQQYNWHLTEKLSEAKTSISSDITVPQFHRVLKDFFLSMRDLHAGIIFHSSAFASLPFEIRSAEGRFFVHRFFDKFVKNPFQVLEPGDEIISMDGEPIKVVVERFFKAVLPSDPSPTETSYALSRFTKRAGAILDPMPEKLDKTTFVIKKKNSKIPLKVSFKWYHTPENMTFAKGPHSGLMTQPLADSPLVEMRTGYDFNVQIRQENVMLQALADKLKVKFNKNFQNALLNKFAENTSDSDEIGEDDGLTEEAINELILFTKQKEGTVIPPLGITIWESKPEDYFEAYIYELNTKQRVGFIRLRTFIPNHTVNVVWRALKNEKQAKEPWEEFADKINYFKDSTDILVIDQTDNRGGADLYTYALASMLTDKPLQNFASHHTLTSEKIYHAIDINANSGKSAKDFFGTDPEIQDQSIFGYPLDQLHMDRMISFYNLLLNHWNNGQMYTDPAHQSGIETIIPSVKANYTKPLIILIDENSMSCGDLFPAIMQDNRRALLFGQTTAGAGGAIKQIDFPNRLGIAQYSYTNSLIIRSNGMPIENIGVIPDVEYQLTADDLGNSYRGYARALRTQIRKLVPSKHPVRIRKEP